jgi:hypothetical protein
MMPDGQFWACALRANNGASAAPAIIERRVIRIKFLPIDISLFLVAHEPRAEVNHTPPRQYRWPKVSANLVAAARVL